MASITIDGLISGIDTQPIIDSLVEASQSQIDRLNQNKSDIVAKQTAFSGIEGQLLTLRGSLSALGRTQNNVLESKLAVSSDEDIVQASASGNAVNGVYTVTVNSLAAAHQIASNTFDSPDAQITQGTLTIQVGSGSTSTITIDSSNNSVQGLVDAINAGSDDVFASLVNDTSGTRILFTGSKTGASESIQITNNLGATAGQATQPDFSGAAVQDAADASITIGSGAGAINVTSATNQFEDVIEGLTFNITSANATKPVNITVNNDIESATSAIEDFVDKFNALMSFIEEQSAFNSVTEEAGSLLGDRNAIAIQNEIRNRLVFSIPGLDSELNQLSALGLNFNDRGQLFIDSAQLSDVLSGNQDDIGIQDIKRLFSLDAQSSNSGIEFILGSSKTKASSTPYQVDITQAAERATVDAGTDLAASIVIGPTNKEFSVSVDGTSTGTLQLAEGTYTRQELADHLETLVNSSDELSGQSVDVSLINNRLRIRSNSYGDQSELNSFSGSALTDLGLTTSDSDQGQDVVGRFLVDGEVEEAIGTGRLLTGSPDNENTADIQLRVTLNSGQVTSGNEADLTVTRGFASQLDQIIADFLDPVTGRIKNANDAFDDQIESIDQSIENTEELIQLKTEQIIREFTAMEQILSNLQTQSNFLAAQLQVPNQGGFGSS